MANVKVTVTFSTKQAYKLARTLKLSGDVSSDQKMTLRAKGMVKVTMTLELPCLVDVSFKAVKVITSELKLALPGSHMP